MKVLGRGGGPCSALSVRMGPLVSFLTRIMGKTEQRLCGGKSGSSFEELDFRELPLTLSDFGREDGSS